MSRLKALLIVLIALMGIALAIYGPIILRESRREKPSDVKKIFMPSMIVAKGVVESSEEAEVSSKVVGRIAEILAFENEYVERAQRLAILDNEEVSARIKEAEALIVKAGADYEKSVADYNRYERLYNVDAVTLIELEEFKRGMKSDEGELLRTRAQLEGAKAALEDHILKSPIDGVVINRNFEVGEVVSPGAAVFLLVNPDLLRVKTDLDETDVGKVYVGQRVEVTTDAYKDRVYKGVVEEVSEDNRRKRIRTFDPLSWIDINSQEITVSLDSFDGLKIGMSVEVRFYPGEGI